MTNRMPGNPHYRNLVNGYSTEDDIEQSIVQTEALLAIAYEQRTANLIRFIEVIDDQTDLKHRIAALEQRLGLGLDQ